MYTHFYKHNTVIILIYYQETNNISLHDCSGLRLTSRSSWWCPQRRSSARPVSWCRLTISCPHWSHCRPSIRKTQRVSDYRGEGIDYFEEWVLFLNISVQEDWLKTTLGRGIFIYHQLHWDRANKICILLQKTLFSKSIQICLRTLYQGALVFSTMGSRER